MLDFEPVAFFLLLLCAFGAPFCEFNPLVIGRPFNDGTALKFPLLEALSVDMDVAALLSDYPGTACAAGLLNSLEFHLFILSLISSMPAPEPSAEPNPKFTITNAHLALLITVLGLLGAGKSYVASYVDSLLVQEKAYAEVRSVSDSVRDISKAMTALQQVDAAQKELITRLEGEITAEKSRAYEADQQQGKLLDVLRTFMTVPQRAEQPAKP